MFQRLPDSQVATRSQTFQPTADFTATVEVAASAEPAPATVVVPTVAAESIRTPAARRPVVLGCLAAACFGE